MDANEYVEKYITTMKTVSRVAIETGAIALGTKLVRKIFPARTFIGKVTNGLIVLMFYSVMCGNLIYSDNAIESREDTFDDAEEFMHEILG